MSDFDKEAERQRLREKYERDEAKRRSTQRMSELLLKGATMTNKHCDECGDPLFRYDGQEFCPTCQAEGRTAASADADAADAAADVAAEADVETEGADAEAEGESTAEQRGPEGTAEPGESAAADAGTVRDDAATRSETGGEPGTGARREPTARARETDATRAGRGSEVRPSATPGPDARPTSEPEGAPRTESTPRDAGGDVASARESLVRTLSWAAAEAEATDDPQRAKTYLAAAREAAEAISALDRSR